jgi:hypothetical protein
VTPAVLFLARLLFLVRRVWRAALVATQNVVPCKCCISSPLFVVLLGLPDQHMARSTVTLSYNQLFDGIEVSMFVGKLRNAYEVRPCLE